MTLALHPTGRRSSARSMSPSQEPPGSHRSPRSSVSPVSPVSSGEPSRSTLELARAGNLDAFDDLIRCYQSRTVALAMRLLNHREHALDVSQDAFLRLWKSRKRLQPNGSAWPYLRQIVVNACRDHWKRAQRFQTADIEDHQEPVDQQPAPDQRTLATEAGALLQICLAELPQRERTAIVLRDVEGVDTRGVAKLLGTSATTVRTQISRGRARLRRLMDGRSRPTASPGPSGGTTR